MLKLKGTVPRDFRALVFLSIEPTLALDQRVKKIQILVKNSSIYSNFKFENLTLRGLMPRPAKFVFPNLINPFKPGKKYSPIFAKRSTVSYRCTRNSNPLEYLRNPFSFKRQGILFSFLIFFYNSQTNYI